MGQDEHRTLLHFAMLIFVTYPKRRVLTGQPGAAIPLVSGALPVGGPHARLDHGAVRLLTRTGLDWTHKFRRSPPPWHARCR
jgi:hypothetical protein